MLASNPYIHALNNVHERRVGLEIFLTDPDVPIDTSHLAQALRVVPWAARTAGPSLAPNTSASSQA